MTMERAETRLVPSFMNKPLTPHSTIATPAYAIQCITSSSDRKDHDGRQGEKHAPHLHLVQPLPQHQERQHHREYGKKPGNWSDDGSILLAEGGIISESPQSGSHAAQNSISNAAPVSIQLPSHLYQHTNRYRQHA